MSDITIQASPLQIVVQPSAPLEFSLVTNVDEKLAEHEGAPDPHPQYTNSSELAIAINAHKSEADPHPQYATDSDLAAAISTRATASDISSAISTHTAAADPHPQYLNGLEATAAVDSGIAAHVAASDPHSQYATDSDLATAIANHNSATDPHPSYVDSSELASALATRQPASTELSLLAGIASTALGRSLLTADSQATARSALGVGVRILWANHAAVTVSGVTGETPFTGRSFVIPANTLVAGSALWIIPVFSHTNLTSAKNAIFKLGNVAITSPAMPTATAYGEPARLIRVRSSSQVFSTINAFNNSASITVSTVDLSVDQTFSIAANLTNAADSITLESIILMILNV